MIIRIENGQTKAPGFKGDYLINKLKIERDLVQLKTSSVTIIKNSKYNIQRGDIIYIHKAIIPIVGIIDSIKDNYDNTLALSIRTGIDSHNNEVFMPTGKLDGYTIRESNRTNLIVDVASKDVVTTTDQNLALDVLLRQSMRKSPKTEVVDKISGGYIVKLRDLNSPPVTFRHNTPNLTYRLELDSNGFNKLRLRDDKDTSLFKDYYLTDTGDIVVSDSSKTTTALVELVEVVGENKYSSLDYAKQKLQGQEYNNKLTLKLKVDNEFYQFKFNESFLGRKLTFITEQEKELKTFVSGYVLENNVLTITCGLTRTKLTDKLKKEV